MGCAPLGSLRITAIDDEYMGKYNTFVSRRFQF